MRTHSFKRTLTALATATVLTAGTAVTLASTQDDSGVLQDAWTHTKVRLALLENVGTDAMRIDIDVDGDQVDLTGVVHDRATIELAKQIVKSVEGVKGVDVELEMAEEHKNGALNEATAELSDAVLETKVKLALLDELGSNAFGIDVESANGIVALSGKVDDKRHGMAIDTAKEVTGVKKVRDLLKKSDS